MTNIFQCSYDTRLKDWYALRKSLEEANISTKCIEIDKWWQKTPLVNHYLHSDFVEDWPNPWELLSENNYCYIARGLGQIYTLHLLGITDIEFVEARDYNNEDVAIVLVDRAKYILNYWPDTVVNNNLQDFKLINKIELSPILRKIG